MLRSLLAYSVRCRIIYLPIRSTGRFLFGEGVPQKPSLGYGSHVYRPDFCERCINIHEKWFTNAVFLIKNVDPLSILKFFFRSLTPSMVKKKHPRFIFMQDNYEIWQHRGLVTQISLPGLSFQFLHRTTSILLVKSGNNRLVFCILFRGLSEWSLSPNLILRWLMW